MRCARKLASEVFVRDDARVLKRTDDRRPTWCANASRRWRCLRNAPRSLGLTRSLDVKNGNTSFGFSMTVMSSAYSSACSTCLRFSSGERPGFLRAATMPRKELLSM